jgi:hypothetical protein
MDEWAVFCFSVLFPTVILSGLVVSVFATGPNVRRLKPGRGRWIFKGDKNLQHDFLWRVSKAIGPMS